MISASDDPYRRTSAIRLSPLGIDLWELFIAGPDSTNVVAIAKLNH